jgi:hypothetical protein
MSAAPVRLAEPAPGVLHKLWRETARPFRPRTWRKWLKLKPAGVNNPDRGLKFKMHAGSVEPAGHELLADLVRRSQAFPGPIVEIGTLFGRTTTHLALHKAPHQKVITVDTYGWNPWGLSRETYYELTSRILHYLVETGNVEQRRMDKAKFYATYDGPPPALVFLDAIHSYEQTKQDIAWARSMRVPIIAGHDYSKRFPGVMRAVDEFGGPAELGGTVFLLGQDNAHQRGAASSRPFNLDEAQADTWDARAAAATQLWIDALPRLRNGGAALPQECSVADLGCGNERLADVLGTTGVPFRYQGYDLLPQSPTVQKLDLARDLPAGRADVTFALGLLEYLPDLTQFFARLRRSTRFAVISYVVADSGAYGKRDWVQRGWLHHYSSCQIVEQFTAAGFARRASAVIDGGRTFLWLLEATEG